LARRGGSRPLAAFPKSEPTEPTEPQNTQQEMSNAEGYAWKLDIPCWIFDILFCPLKKRFPRWDDLEGAPRRVIESASTPAASPGQHYRKQETVQCPQ
jgi:hypothetical protein